MQKGATSELSRRLYELGVSDGHMTKEWDLVDTLDRAGAGVKIGVAATNATVAAAVFAAAAAERAGSGGSGGGGGGGGSLAALRSAHYALGFPRKVGADEAAATAGQLPIPLIDNAPVARRRLVFDASVDYHISDRAADLIHRLTPHARIVMTFREPIDRALSQYNMMTRLHNRDRRARGEAPVAASPDHFHYIVTREVALLKYCGYDHGSGTLTGSAANVSALLTCMAATAADPAAAKRARLPSHSAAKPSFDNVLYVTRGLYVLHVDTWTARFPAGRFLYLRFDAVTAGAADAMGALAAFACVRPYPPPLLRRYAAAGSAGGALSHGQQVAAGRPAARGEVGWTYDGADAYVGRPQVRTRRALKAFYGGAERRLVRMLGQRMWD